MALSEQQLDRLDDLLLLMPDEAMLLPTPDGVLTGIVLCPETIPRSEWLPLVWEEPDETQSNLLRQGDLIKEVTGLVMAHFNGLAAQRENPDRKIFPEIGYHDVPGHEEIDWESWIAGFFEAVLMRLPAWEPVFECDDEEAVSSFSMLAALDLIDCGDRKSVV